MWKFCTNEEHVVGQDEATLRPIRSFSFEDLAYGPDGVCRVRVRLSSGAKFIGFISFNNREDLTIITKKVQVHFNLGVIFSTEKTDEAIKDAFRSLGVLSASEIFPIRYGTDFPHTGIKAFEGEISGFLVYDEQSPLKSRLYKTEHLVILPKTIIRRR